MEDRKAGKRWEEPHVGLKRTNKLVYPDDGILLSPEEEQGSDTCYNMEGPQTLYIK